MTPTCGCGKPVHSTFICAQCAHTLDVALGNVAAYHADLDTLRTRQARYTAGGAVASVGRTQPLGIDLRFTPGGSGSLLEAATRTTVVGWVRVVLDEQPPLAGPTCERACLHVSCAHVRRRRHPVDTVASCCAYLARQRRHIAAAAWAPDLFTDILHVERRLARLVDRPPERWYAGVCGSVTDTDTGPVVCVRELYATADAVAVQCRNCDCTYDVAARRVVLLAEAADRQATVEALVRIVTTLGAVHADSGQVAVRVRQWATRGHLVANGARVVDGRVRPTYRVGDVLDLFAARSA